MADQRKAPVRHLQWNDIHSTRQLQRFAACASLFHYDITVADSPVLQRYLDIKHNRKQWELRTLGHGGNFLSVTGEHVFALCDRCNKQCPQWVVMGDKVVYNRGSFVSYGLALYNSISDS